MPKSEVRYEVEYRSVPIVANIAEGLYPYLVAEAKRRKVSIDTLVGQIVNEDLGRKRIQSRKKDAKPLNGAASVIAK